MTPPASACHHANPDAPAWLQDLESATPRLRVDGVEFAGLHEQMAGTGVIISEQQPPAASILDAGVIDDVTLGGGRPPVMPVVVALAARKIVFHVVAGDINTLRAY